MLLLAGHCICSLFHAYPGEQIKLLRLVMAKLKLSGKDLRAIGYPESPVISLAMDIMEKNYKRNSKEHALGLLKTVLVRPHEYAEDEILGKIARALIEREQKAAAKAATEVNLKPEGVAYN